MPIIHNPAALTAMVDDADRDVLASFAADAGTTIPGLVAMMVGLHVDHPMSVMGFIDMAEGGMVVLFGHGGGVVAPDWRDDVLDRTVIKPALCSVPVETIKADDADWLALNDALTTVAAVAWGDN